MLKAEQELNAAGEASTWLSGECEGLIRKPTCRRFTATLASRRPTATTGTRGALSHGQPHSTARAAAPNGIYVPQIVISTAIVNGQLVTLAQAALAAAAIDANGNYTRTGQSGVLQIQDVNNLDADLAGLQSQVTQLFTTVGNRADQCDPQGVVVAIFQATADGNWSSHLENAQRLKLGGCRAGAAVGRHRVRWQPICGCGHCHDPPRTGLRPMAAWPGCTRAPTSPTAIPLPASGACSWTRRACVTRSMPNRSMPG